MKKIFITIITFLLMLFNQGIDVLIPTKPVSFPGRSSVNDTIIDAINNDDVSAVVDMMSKELKNELENPEKRTEEFFDNIDGKIIGMDWGGGTEKIDNPNGYHFSGWTIVLITETESYLLDISWVLSKASNCDEIGLNGLRLKDGGRTPSGSIIFGEVICEL